MTQQEQKQMLYKKLNLLRIEVDGSIVEDIMQTVDALFAPAPACRPQTHNFHIARHEKCQDCGGTEWMDAPAPAQGVEEEEAGYPVKPVVFFVRKDGKYVAENGKQVMIDFLLKREHAIYHDDGYVVLSGSRWQQGELEALRRWKAEAIEVMPDMQAIGKALGLRIDESIHDKILPGIEKLKQKAATPTIGARWVSGTPKLTAPCVFVSKTSSKTGYDYAVWEAMYIDNGDGSYLALCDGDGEEWGDIADFHCDAYYMLSPATFPTREQAEKWADESYPGDDIFAISARKYMIQMYDWIMSKITTP